MQLVFSFSLKASQGAHEAFLMDMLPSYVCVRGVDSAGMVSVALGIEYLVVILFC